MTEQQRTYIWDLPTRLFHWTLVVLVSISLGTGLLGGFEIMDYHMLSGYCILALVLFRLVWGLLGNQHARFTSFIRGPAAIRDYALQLRGQRAMAPHAGHNPLGALSVLALLGTLLVQAGTGLFATDEILLEGPLLHLVSDDISGMLTGLHTNLAWGIMGLVALHVLAIIYYWLARAENLVLPMLTGWRQLATDPKTQNASNPWLRGLLAFCIVAAGVYYLVTYV
jgi:cytochrome b